MVNKHNKEILRNFKSKSDFPDEHLNSYLKVIQSLAAGSKLGHAFLSIIASLPSFFSPQCLLFTLQRTKIVSNNHSKCLWCKYSSWVLNTAGAARTITERHQVHVWHWHNPECCEGDCCLEVGTSIRKCKCECGVMVSVSISILWGSQHSQGSWWGKA